MCSQQHLQVVPLILQKLLSKWRDRFSQRYHLAVITMKCAKIINTIAHRSSRALPRTALGFFEKFTTYSPSTIHNWSPHFAPATHLGRRMGSDPSSFTLGDLKPTHPRQFRHKLVVGNWNITSLTGKNTNWSRKPNDITRMLSSRMNLPC